MNNTKPGGTPRRRLKTNQHVTKSGKVIKVNRSLTDHIKAKKESRARARAAYLSTMPQGRLRRMLFRMHPKRVARYWFSRQGLKMALTIGGVGVLTILIGLAGVFAYYRKDLPKIKDVEGDKLKGSNQYFAKDGTTFLYEDFDTIKRVPVTSDKINDYMKQATIAIEDREFYEHNGFNLKGISRAAINNSLGKSTQGGSTITQQLVKVTQEYTNDRSVQRKIKELILAIELERSYSKEDILVGYLNAAPYGGIEVGVEAAAENYFGKTSNEITLDEAAMLVSIPKSPTYYSPYSKSNFDKEALIGRQHYVLDSMVELGYIKPEERDAAKKIDTVAKVKPRPSKYENIKAPYFVIEAIEQLKETLTDKTVQRGGYKITTTLDPKLQQIAEEEMAKGIKQVRKQGGNKAAFVAEDVKTGQIVAMVGGDDFNNKDEAGEVNFATRPLPPGSSIKPYDYVTLIENSDKFGAGSVLYDTKGPVPGYPCTNQALPEKGGNCIHDFSRTFTGPISLRYALGGSLNVPAVKATAITGITKIQETVVKLGAKNGYKCYQDGARIGDKEKESECGNAAGIGDGAYIKLDEHVHSFGSLSRNGRALKQTYILKVQDSKQRILEEWKEDPGIQAVRPDAAYIVSDMLSDPKASFFATKPHLYKGHKFAVKTGTTNDAKDGWMMGYSTQYAAGVWVGDSKNSPRCGADIKFCGLTDAMTLPIWGGFMRRVHDDLKPIEREKPTGIQTLPAFVYTKRIYGQVSPSPSTDLYPSWYKGNKKADNKKVTIDRVSDKLATDCTPARAKKEIINSNSNTFSGDPFIAGGAAANTEEKDDVHKCEDSKPRISLNISDKGAGEYLLTATVSQGTHPLSSSKFSGTVNFVLGGQILQSFQVNGDGPVSYTYKVTTSGEKIIMAEVVDSVLYDASDAKTQTFSMGNPTSSTTPAPPPSTLSVPRSSGGRNTNND